MIKLCWVPAVVGILKMGKQMCFGRREADVATTFVNRKSSSREIKTLLKRRLSFVLLKGDCNACQDYDQVAHTIYVVCVNFFAN